MTPGIPKPADRRSHPRIALDWPLSVSLSEGKYEARLRDISKAGVCFYLDRRIPEMTVLQMSIDLPGTRKGADNRIEGSGVVVRCQPLSELVDHYEIAVFLNDVSEEHQEKLEAYVTAGMKV